MGEYEAAWEAPSVAQVRAYANEEDTTENGAYCVALAAADAHLGLRALRRCESRSGADYYLIPADVDPPEDPDLDLEHPALLRLEVSGVDDDEETIFRARLRRKLDQLSRGSSDVPAIAGVVGFKGARVSFASQK